MVGGYTAETYEAYEEHGAGRISNVLASKAPVLPMMEPLSLRKSIGAATNSGLASSSLAGRLGANPAGGSSSCGSSSSVLADQHMTSNGSSQQHMAVIESEGADKPHGGMMSNLGAQLRTICSGVVEGAKGDKKAIKKGGAMSRSGSRLVDEDASCFRKKVHELVHGPVFDIICGSVVLASTLFIGWDAHFIAQNPGSEHTVHKTMHLIINMFFMAELSIRVCADGIMGFFCHNDWRWNWMDVGLVSTSVAEILISSGGSKSGFAVTSGRQLRVIRILRLVRTVRLFRSLKSIHEFRKMLYAIISSLRTLVCALLMLFFVIYFFAVLVCSGVADYRITAPVAQQHTDLVGMYGGLWVTIFTLFAAVSNGLSWANVVDPLMDMDIIFPVAIMFYITIVIFGVSNVVTSVFVESAVKTSQHYKDLLVDEKLQKKDIALKHIKAVFEAVDEDNSGCLSKAELEAIVDEPELKSYIDALEISGEDARMFFRLLDADGSGEVDMKEFMDGCLRLQGDAKSIDVHALIHSTKVTLARFAHFADFCEEKFTKLAHLNGADMAEWGGRGLSRRVKASTLSSRHSMVSTMSNM